MKENKETVHNDVFVLESEDGTETVSYTHLND